MTDVAAERGKIDLGRVISGTFQVIGRNIAAFSILGLLLSGLPVGVVAFIQAGWARAQLANLSNGELNLSAQLLTGSGLSVLAALVTTAILQGALIHTTVQDLSGQKPALGESLATGLRSFLPLIAVSILFALAVVFGCVFLLVPGIMVLCAWCVAAPALVADRTGVFGAFGRSAELTRGNRWSIFGLVVILFIVSIVVDTIFNAVAGVSTFGATDPLKAAERLLNPLVIGMTVIRQTVTTVVIAAAVSVLYVELRRAREGLGPEWLREIFA